MKELFRIRTKRTPAEKEAIYALPLHVQYEVVCVNVATHYRVWQHVLVDPTARDYQQVYAVAIAYTEECDCWVNPVVVANEKVGRAKIYPHIKDNASPDLFTKKYGYLDVKSPQNKSNIVRNANSACQQGAIAVITDLMLYVVNEEITQEEISKFTARIFSKQNKNHLEKPNYTQDQIHWFIKGILIKCNRSETL